MFSKIVFWLVLVPIAIIILMFAVANREHVTVSFDPFSAHAPAAAISVPVFVLVFVLVILGIFIGGVASWLRQSAYRRAARQRDAEVNALRREIDALNARLNHQADRAATDNAARLVYRPPAAR